MQCNVEAMHGGVEAMKSSVNVEAIVPTSSWLRHCSGRAAELLVTELMSGTL